MKYKKQSKFKSVALGMALVLAMGASGTALAMGVKNNDWFKPDDQIEDELPNENDGGEQTDKNENIAVECMLLSMDDEVVAAVSETGEQTVTQRVSAIVKPDDAPDKRVAWTIEWETPPSDGADISEYLTIEPYGDSTLIIDVVAHKAFRNAVAVLKATTYVGNYTATVKVRYEGKPNTLVLLCDGVEYGETSGNKTIRLAVGQTKTATVNLDNVFHDVGEQYYDSFNVYFVGTGHFVALKEYIRDGVVQSSEDVVLGFGASGINYTFQVIDGTYRTLEVPHSDFFTATISDRTITFSGIQTVSSLKKFVPLEGVNNDGEETDGYRFTYKSAYVDPHSLTGTADSLYWVMNTNVDGVSYYIDFVPVTGVEIDRGDLEF